LQGKIDECFSAFQSFMLAHMCSVTAHIVYSRDGNWETYWLSWAAWIVEHRWRVV